MTERRVNVRGIAFHKGQLLAQKFRTYEGGETNYWGTPGGGLDQNEALEDGLKREMLEETGITPEIGRLLFIQQFTFQREDGQAREQLEFFFHIINSKDYTSVDLSKTTHGLEELTRCEFIDPKKEVVLPKFLQSIDIQSYIDTTRPVYFYTEM